MNRQILRNAKHASFYKKIMKSLALSITMYAVLFSNSFASIVYTFEGTVNSTSGGTPSLNQLNLSTGDALRYTILVDFTRDGFTVDNDSMDMFFYSDGTDSTGTSIDYFYAELIDLSYTQPQDLILPQNTNFYAANISNDPFSIPSDYSVLEVGLNSLRLTSSEQSSTWGIGSVFTSNNIWTDIQTGSTSGILGDLEITSITTIPLPLPLLLFGSGLIGIAAFTKKTTK